MKGLWQNWLRRERSESEREIREELDFHLEMRTRENIARGLDEEAARRDAERRFGRAGDYAAQMRWLRERQAQRTRRRAWWSGLWQDVVYGARAHAKRPGFTAVLLLTLGLGIGANTALFTIAERLLFTDIAGVRDPSSLATVRFSREGAAGAYFVLSHADYLDLRESVPVFESLAGSYPTEAHVRLPGEEMPRRLTAELITENYAATLGLAPLIGRAPDGGAQTPERVVMISERLWTSSFGRRADVAGTLVTINGKPFELIGVASRGYQGPRGNEEVDLWVPVEAHADILPGWGTDVLTSRHNGMYLDLFARLQDGTTVERSEEQTTSAIGRIVGVAPESSLKGMLPNVTPGVGLTPHVRAELRGMMRVLGGVVAFILLLGCANAANLLLARASVRAPELALRRAIGAGRGRLIRQLVTEGVMLGLAAGLLGAVLAQGSVLALRGARVLTQLPPLPDVSVSGRALLFALTASALTGVLFSTAPAFALTRSNESLRSAGRVTVGRSRLRSGLIVAQMAISLGLVVGAGLLVRTVAALRSIDPGFEPGAVLEASVDPGIQGYDSGARARFFQLMLERSRTIPGVRAAGMSWAPVQGFMRASALPRPEGEPEDGERAIRAAVNGVLPGSIAALGIELIAGRDFREEEMYPPSDQATGVAIVSETTARTMFPQSSAVGRRIDVGYASPRILEIVGVIRDVRMFDVREPGGALLLEPFGQAGWIPSFATLYAQAERAPDPVAAELRAVARDLDASLPLYDVQSLSARIEERLVAERWLARLSTSFAALAVLLAGIGLYGVMAFAVTQRAREFGVRLALGAAARSVHLMVLGEVLRTTLIGIGAGLLVGWAVARLVSSHLWGVSPSDPVSFFLAGVVLLVTALFAGWWPAWRATRVDPASTLRVDAG